MRGLTVAALVLLYALAGSIIAAIYLNARHTDWLKAWSDPEFLDSRWRLRQERATMRRWLPKIPRFPRKAA